MSPRKVELVTSGVPFCKMRIITPAKPIARPVPLRNEIFSFRIRAANTKANIGFVDSIIDELIGEVMSSPRRKSDWLMTTPKMHTDKRYSRSFFCTGSFGMKRLVIQKRKTAPRLRRDRRANGFMLAGITAFAIEKFSP
jgi:hypothetical protein